MLDLRRLRYFYEIGERGSISAAARALNVAQPALSHHVMELERSLGMALLERLSRGVRLTQAGRILHQHARAILDQVAKAEEDVRRLRGDLPPIRLAIIPSLAVSLTPALFAAAAQELPGVALHLFEMRTDHSHELIGSGRVDFAVNLADSRWPAGETLISEPLFLAQAGSGGPAPSTAVRFQELASLRLIMPERNNPLRRIVEDAAARAGITLDVIMEIDGLQSLKEAVAAGIGASVLSWHAVRHECGTGMLIARRIRKPSIDRSVVLESREQADPRIRALMRGLLLRSLKSVPATGPGHAAPRSRYRELLHWPGCESGS